LQVRILLPLPRNFSRSWEARRRGGWEQFKKVNREGTTGTKKDYLNRVRRERREITTGTPMFLCFSPKSYGSRPLPRAAKRLDRIYRIYRIFPQFLDETEKGYFYAKEVFLYRCEDRFYNRGLK
jgi:hypothetical protein